jgi:HSP20 family molecular chaperone IbpA
MCERKSDYLADIDMPGLEDKESITVQWTSPRTLLIEVLISRPQIEDWDAEADEAKAEPGDKSNEEEVTWISSERRIGKLVRILFFPSDVDMRALKARLRAGVLRIQVPKRFAGFEGWKVQVE